MCSRQNSRASHPCDAAKRSGRPFQYSVRTLVVGVVFLGALFGLLSQRIHQARRQAEAVQMLHAQGVEFHFGRSLLSQIAGHYFAPVLRVYASQSSISDSHLKYLAQLPDVETLHLSETSVTDKGMVHIATLEKLEVLDLTDTSVSDEGLSTLKSLPALKRLNLMKTSVTDDALRHVAELDGLEDLVLSWTNVTDDGVRRFRPLCTNFIRVHR